MNDSHVANVVNVDALFQADHQSLFEAKKKMQSHHARTRRRRRRRATTHVSIEAHREDRVGITVVAYFRALLEMVDAQFPGIGHAHDGDEAAGEEALDDANVLDVALARVRLLQLLERVYRVQSVAGLGAHCQRSAKTKRNEPAN